MNIDKYIGLGDIGLKLYKQKGEGVISEDFSECLCYVAEQSIKFLFVDLCEAISSIKPDDWLTPSSMNSFIEKVELSVPNFYDMTYNEQKALSGIKKTIYELKEFLQVQSVTEQSEDYSDNDVDALSMWGLITEENKARVQISNRLIMFDFLDFKKSKTNTDCDLDKVSRTHASVDNRAVEEPTDQELLKLKEENGILTKQVAELQEKDKQSIIDYQCLQKERDGLNQSIQAKNQEIENLITEIKLTKIKLIDAGELIDDTNKKVGLMIDEYKNLLVVCYQQPDSSNLKATIIDHCTKVLNRYGIQILNAEEGGRFDPSKQVAVSTISTEDKSLTGTIASTVRIGFYSESSGKCEHQKVIIYQ